MRRWTVLLMALTVGVAAGLVSPAHDAVAAERPELRAIIGGARQDNQATVKVLPRLTVEDARLVREQLGLMRDSASLLSDALADASGPVPSALESRIRLLGSQAKALRMGADAARTALDALNEVRRSVHNDLQSGLASGFPSDMDQRQLRWSLAGAHALADRNAALRQIASLQTVTHYPSGWTAWSQASSGITPARIAGLTAIPGGCALPTASEPLYLPARGTAGPYLWTSQSQVARHAKRLESPSFALDDAHRTVVRQATVAAGSAGRLGTPSEMTRRALLMGYAWLMTGDEVVRQGMIADLRALSTHRADKDLVEDAKLGIVLATLADWLADDPASRADVAKARRVLEIRFLGAMGCSIALGEGIATDKLNKSVIIGSATAMVAMALSRTSTARDGLAAAVRGAIAAARPGMAVMDPDGGSPEGADYWNFQTVPAAGLLSSIDGTLPSLTRDSVPQLRQAGDFAWHATAGYGGGETTAFADTRGGVLRGTLPAWIAGRYGDPEAIAVALQGQFRQGVELLWWPDEDKAQSARVDTAFPKTSLAVLHAGDATAWLKGQADVNNHTHLDAGTVTVRAEGVDWSFDAGYGNPCPGYSEESPDGRRWSCPQAMPAWHSTLRTASSSKDLGQRVGALARVSLRSGAAVVDLTDVLPQVRQASRTVRLAKGTLTMVDRVEGARQPYRWAWVTQASASVSGSSVRLSQSGSTATLRFTGLPAGSKITVSRVPGSLGALASRVEVALPPSTRLEITATLNW